MLKITKNKTIFEIEAFVESETKEGIFYRVTAEDENWTCSCPAGRYRGGYCKHIKKVKDEI